MTTALESWRKAGYRQRTVQFVSRNLGQGGKTSRTTRAVWIRKTTSRRLAVVSRRLRDECLKALKEVLETKEDGSFKVAQGENLNCRQS